jgi:hypothetical protein
MDSAKAKSSDAVIDVTNAKSRFQIGNRERASSERAKECSPQRKLWVVGKKMQPASEGLGNLRFPAANLANIGVRGLGLDI